MIAIDYETYLISNAEPAPKPVCLSYFDGKESGLAIGFPEIKALLARILPSETIIAHNMSFEALVTDAHFPEFKPLLKQAFKDDRLKCTKINEQLIDNLRKKSVGKFTLAALVEHYFDEDISAEKNDPDAWRLRYSELDGVPREEWPNKAVSYAIDDSIWAYKVYQEQEKTPVDDSLSVSADFYLNKMGFTGFQIDLDRVKTLEKELLDHLTPSYGILNKHRLLNIKKKNGLDPKGKVKWKSIFSDMHEKFVEKQAKLLPDLYTDDDLKAGIFKGKLDAHLKEVVPNPKYTVKGGLSTKGEHLEEYIAECPDDEILKAYATTKEYEKVLSAFVSRLKEADPVIRTQYNAVVSSGRTSSRTSMAFPSVNIQQMPRGVSDVTWDIRNCFVPRKGYKIVSIDYAGLELASTANQLKVLTGKTDMLRRLNSGDVPVDMHSMLAHVIMNLKEGTSETYQSFVSRKKEKKYAAYRQLSKPINLGFPGGIGYGVMRSQLAKEGIYPKLVVLKKAVNENRLKWDYRAAKKEGYPVRIRRTGFREYELIYDELVQLKQEFLALYPDLGDFLSEGHMNYLTGEQKMVKNEYGEWEKEPMYSYEVGGFKRDWCMYTQICNGLLMQSPSAIGAKKAMVKIIEKYGDSEVMNPLAFIHDEIVFEVIDSEERNDIIDDVSEILIDEMQSVLTHVRIAVEAEVFDYWRKAGGEWEKMYWKDPGKPELRS